MHELGITQGIVDRARDAAVEGGAKQVTDVSIVMTPAADFTEDSIVMYFDMLTQDDDLLRGAALHVEHRPVSAVCLDVRSRVQRRFAGAGVCAVRIAQVRLDPEAPMILLTEVVIDDERGEAPPSGSLPI